jgi:hypothetical protein
VNGRSSGEGRAVLRAAHVRLVRQPAALEQEVLDTLGERLTIARVTRRELEAARKASLPGPGAARFFEMDDSGDGIRLVREVAADRP